MARVAARAVPAAQAAALASSGCVSHPCEHTRTLARTYARWLSAVGSKPLALPCLVGSPRGHTTRRRSRAAASGLYSGEDAAEHHDLAGCSRVDPKCTGRSWIHGTILLEARAWQKWPESPPHAHLKEVVSQAHIRTTPALPPGLSSALFQRIRVGRRGDDGRPSRPKHSVKVGRWTRLCAPLEWKLTPGVVSRLRM